MEMGALAQQGGGRRGDLSLVLRTASRSRLEEAGSLLLGPRDEGARRVKTARPCVYMVPRPTRPGAPHRGPPRLDGNADPYRDATLSALSRESLLVSAHY
jgi:hypothetical protein